MAMLVKSFFILFLAAALSR